MLKTTPNSNSEPSQHQLISLHNRNQNIDQNNSPRINEHKLSYDQILQDQSSYQIKDIREKYIKQNKSFLRRVIFKSIMTGLLFGVILFTLLSDKVFFKQYQHYYRGKQQIIKKQPDYIKQKINSYHIKQSNQNNKNNNLSENENEKMQITFIQHNKQNKQWESQKVSNNINNYNSIYVTPLSTRAQNSVVTSGNIFSLTSYHQINQVNLVDKYIFDDVLMQTIQSKQLDQSIQKLDKYLLSIKLLQLPHNINFNGKISLIQTKHQPTQQSMFLKRQRIQKTLRLQKQYYNKYYQIQKYKQHQLTFCVIVPSYNNYKSRLYLRNLNSIFMQDYQNYHVVYIDDASPDKTGEYVKIYVKDNHIPQDKINIIINQQNVLALQNIYKAIHQYCNQGEIVMLLDGDDSFLGTQVMTTFNAVYQKNKAGFVYSQYVTISNNKYVGYGGSSMSIPKQILQKDTFRKQKMFYTSHLVTFYADLFKMIKKQDLTYDNGTFFNFAYDVAITTPMIEMVNPRIVFLRQNSYQYRFDTGINDPGWGQIQVNDIVYSKQPYKRLKDFSFIDKFYEDIQKKKSVKQQQKV